MCSGQRYIRQDNDEYNGVSMSATEPLLLVVDRDTVDLLKPGALMQSVEAVG